MLTLYIKTGCPFCAKVVPTFEALEGVEKEIKNTADEGALEELLEKGGQRQVPFLIDSEKEVSMYESDDILEYLKKEYGGGEVTPETPAQGGVCPIQ